MQDVLLLRFDAPLIAFGDVAIDHIRKTRPFPALSMLTGLLANALGYDHADTQRLNQLQQRLRYAVRCDRQGTELHDYQTVDLSQPFLQAEHVGWTTWGKVEEREGGKAKEGTHIRNRYYIANAIYTIALTLDPAEKDPTLSRVETALREPARPLFIGRKSCLPASPILLQRASYKSLLEALVRAPLPDPSRLLHTVSHRYYAWWPDDEPIDYPNVTLIRTFPVFDRRDWESQVHTGRRWICEGEINIPKNEETDS